MAPDASAAPANGDEKVNKKKQERQASKEADVDVGALERRVHLAELRVREIEAELRYLELSQKRRSMKSERRGKGNSGRNSGHDLDRNAL